MAKRVKSRSAAPPNMVSVWLDDPASGMGRLDRPVPDLAKGALRFRIKGAKVAPGIYAPGTPQFRYWAAAEPLRRGADFWVVPASAIHPLQAPQRRAVRAVRAAAASPTSLPSRKVAIPAAPFGLGDRTIVVVAPMERNPFLTAAAGLAHRFEPPVEEAARRFVKMLFAHRRVDIESGKRRAAVSPETPREHLRKTHVLTETAEGLRLSRRLFHCGCGACERD